MRRACRIKIYRGAEKGLDIIREMKFETEEGAARVMDLDKPLFDEQEDPSPVDDSTVELAHGAPGCHEFLNSTPLSSCG